MMETDKSSECICYGCSELFDTNIIKKCSRCKIAHYCSVTCQQMHWPEHKLSCKQVNNTIINRINSILKNHNYSAMLKVFAHHWSQLSNQPGYIQCEIVNKMQDGDPFPKDPLSMGTLKWIVFGSKQSKVDPDLTIKGQHNVQTICDDHTAMSCSDYLSSKQQYDATTIKLSVVTLDTVISFNVSSRILMLRLPEKNNYVFAI